MPEPVYRLPISGKVITESEFEELTVVIIFIMGLAFGISLGSSITLMLLNSNIILIVSIFLIGPASCIVCAFYLSSITPTIEFITGPVEFQEENEDSEYKINIKLREGPEWFPKGKVEEK